MGRRGGCPVRLQSWTRAQNTAGCGALGWLAVAAVSPLQVRRMGRFVFDASGDRSRPCIEAANERGDVGQIFRKGHGLKLVSCLANGEKVLLPYMYLFFYGMSTCLYPLVALVNRGHHQLAAHRCEPNARWCKRPHGEEVILGAQPHRPFRHGLREAAAPKSPTVPIRDRQGTVRGCPSARNTPAQSPPRRSGDHNGGAEGAEKRIVCLSVMELAVACVFWACLSGTRLRNTQDLRRPQRVP